MKLLSVLMLFITTIGFSQTIDTLFVTKNPFLVSTTIRFTLTKADSVSVDIFDLSGKNKDKLYDKAVLESGMYSIENCGEALSEGIYLLHLKTSKESKIIKLLKTSDGLLEVENENSKMYPNPTKDYVSLPYVENNTVLLFNDAGQLCLEVKNKIQIDVRALDSGVYHLVIKNEQGKIVFREKLQILRE